MNRIEMLQEMGIAPVWLPRAAPGVGVAGAQKADLINPAKPLVGAVARGSIARSGSQSASQGMPVRQGDDSVLLAALPSAVPVAAPSALPLPDASASSGRSRGVTPRTAPAAAAMSAIDPARIEQIARMDWTQLRESVAGCQACGLCKGRDQAVFGSGDEQADLLIIGEAPGQEEDRQGEPFVGQAGKLLDAMLAALGLTRRANVYITNTLKCRPPGNRNPEALEMAQCAPFLIRQVELLAPKVILLMGRFAVQSILETDASIASLRGKRHAYRSIPAVVTYHPAYLLRNLPDKAKAWEDLLLARELLAESTAP